MLCRFTALRRKEVINLCDGCRLGYVGDVEVTVPEGAVKAIIVFGPCRFFGLFGRGEDYYIPWECVQKFGDDIILVDKPFRRDPPPPPKRRKSHSFHKERAPDAPCATSIRISERLCFASKWRYSRESVSPG